MEDLKRRKLDEAGNGQLLSVPSAEQLQGLLDPLRKDQLFDLLVKLHGEIEEGSVAYDKETNKSCGFGFVTYKTVEAARKAIEDPNKILGGRNLTVKLADTQNRGTLFFCNPFPVFHG
ncbi:PREDICTED: glycine-rich RNA-binding protein-like isoform X2 [Nelumbo nucifera]|uniref:Glycine-rich RNA-binding protein-like isoform X2 n=2 Tax=Nelumbo nucifera TaxID=4432 RepID=A0A1U8A7K3_NELNU|nr:PREDICTED: glycine-rich RNA-binding protein-like isoform X2 [Nelumbo nucifera]DAD42222.1 TPA_asm: hypothetical protein HUJ06_000452 [Nelumbo nucifera]